MKCQSLFSRKCEKYFKIFQNVICCNFYPACGALIEYLDIVSCFCCTSWYILPYTFLLSYTKARSKRSDSTEGGGDIFSFFEGAVGCGDGFMYLTSPGHLIWLTVGQGLLSL